MASGVRVIATTSCPPARCSSSETTALPKWPLAPLTPIFMSASNTSPTNKSFVGITGRRGRGRLKRGIIGIALRGAAKEAGAIRFVHRRSGFHPCDEIRVGKDHLAVGFQIGQPRSHVNADLVARTTGPVHDQRLLPPRAYVAQQQ